MVTGMPILHVTKRNGSTNFNYVVILVILYKCHQHGCFGNHFKPVCMLGRPEPEIRCDQIKCVCFEKGTLLSHVLMVRLIMF